MKGEVSMFRLLTISTAALSLALMIGCSGVDSTQVLVHPEAVTPSATFDVALVNLYTYIDTAGAVISNDVTRDSLHLLIGLPESWDVTEAKAAVVKDMGTEGLLAMQADLTDLQSAAALLEQYKASATALVVDDALAGVFSGDTVSAHGGVADSSVEVVMDQVARLKGFGGPVNISIPAGSNADTVLPLDSMIAFVNSTGLVPDSTMTMLNSLTNFPGLKIPDTLGIVMVPVVVFLKIKAGSTEGDDTLYYFTKTGSMGQAPSPIITAVTLVYPQMKPMLSGLESGDMVYVPVTVSNAASVVVRKTGGSFDNVSVVADRSSGTVRISLGSFAGVHPVVEVYSLRGARIASPGMQQRSGSAAVVWNGTDLRGNRVPAGTYLLRISGDHGTAMVRRLDLMR